MTPRHLTRQALTVMCGALWLLAVATPPAQAHPLGNFSINHYTGFTLFPDRVEVLAVTDTAEIPTLQAAPAVDANAGGTQSDKRALWAVARCAETARRLVVTSPTRLTWTPVSSAFTYQPGQAGLRTSRLECRLRAPLALSDGPVPLSVDTGADTTRVGWNEITATGVGTHLEQSTVPRSSPTGALRHYPRDLLATPLGDTRARFIAILGTGAPSTGSETATGLPGGGLANRFESLTRHLTSLAGTQHLTVALGVLAVLLSILLGAGHALLPGHGKTVMAAYLAGRRGRARDAVAVGATVTITHTAGVLVVGLCLTTFSTLAGDSVLNWLGAASGALVTLIGAGLLLDALRRNKHSRNPALAQATPQLTHQELALVGVLTDATEEHDQRVAQDPHSAAAHPHPHDHTHNHGLPHSHQSPHSHGLFGSPHSHDHAPHSEQPFTTRGLIGLGIAGGLVPSPSALVVLLGAIALGRTAFGATLVVAYGLGMAATLTLVGLLLVRLGDRLGALSDRPSLALLRKVAPHTAALTAILVVVVGLGLTIRSLASVL